MNRIQQLITIHQRLPSHGPVLEEVHGSTSPRSTSIHIPSGSGQTVSPLSLDLLHSNRLFIPIEGFDKDEEWHNFMEYAINNAVIRIDSFQSGQQLYESLARSYKSYFEDKLLRSFKTDPVETLKSISTKKSMSEMRILRLNELAKRSNFQGGLSEEESNELYVLIKAANDYAVRRRILDGNIKTPLQGGDYPYFKDICRFIDEECESNIGNIKVYNCEDNIVIAQHVMKEELEGKPVDLTKTILIADGETIIGGKWIHTIPRNFPIIEREVNRLFERYLALRKVLHSQKHPFDDDALAEANKINGELHWWLSQKMQFYRGSGGITSMFTRVLYDAIGIVSSTYKDGVAPDRSALSSNRVPYSESFGELFSSPPSWAMHL